MCTVDGWSTCDEPMNRFDVGWLDNVNTLTAFVRVCDGQWLHVNFISRR